MKVGVIGAGPAGLAFAERLKAFCPNAKIVIYEKSKYIGGISKTVNYKGNRIDIGGHRFFSKSDEVMKWWTNKFPIDLSTSNERELIKYQGKERSIDGFRIATDKEKKSGKVMLLRKRKSRILFDKKLYDYPLNLNIKTIKNIGIIDMINVSVSYIKAKVSHKNLDNLEDFVISRFGKKLYSMFFETYTEKVWGRHPKEISAEWGAQRIKGLSIRRVLLDIFSKLWETKDFDKKSISQKGTETSLIERFLYPKYGPGQMWEEVAKELARKDVLIKLESPVLKVFFDDNDLLIKGIEYQDLTNQLIHQENFDYVVSTMPISELVENFSGEGSKELLDFDLKRIAKDLPYRDFITVGLLLKNISGPSNETLDDTWIYIQEDNVKVGRLQIFNNWSPFLVANQETYWVGLEYFCNKSDSIWKMEDDKLIDMAISELVELGFSTKEDLLDGTVLREANTYPAYFDSYMELDKLKDFFDKIPNLFLVGRNGMHKYNNQDHSMLTGFKAAELISQELISADNKSCLWVINTEQEYHEEK